MSDSDPINFDIDLRTEGDVLATIPFLVGYHPQDEAIVLFIAESQLVMTLIVSDAAALQAEQVLRNPIAAHAPTKLVIVGYGADLFAAGARAQALQGIATALVDEVVVISALNGVASVEGTPIAMQLWLNSTTPTFGSRDEMDSWVGADPSMVAKVKVPGGRVRVGRALRDLVASIWDGTPDEAAVSALVVGMATDPKAIEQVALQLTRESATSIQEALLIVARSTEDEEAKGALAALALASWVAGEGALANRALERAARCGGGTGAWSPLLEQWTPEDQRGGGTGAWLQLVEQLIPLDPEVAWAVVERVASLTRGEY